jgi:hypothetical protein
MVNHLGPLLGSQAIEIEHRHLWTPQPRWRELRPESKDHQDPQRGNAIDQQIERLARRRVAPMDILEYHEYRLPRGKALDLGQLRVQRLLLSLLGRQVKSRIRLAGRNREQAG